MWRNIRTDPPTEKDFTDGQVQRPALAATSSGMIFYGRMSYLDNDFGFSDLQSGYIPWGRFAWWMYIPEVPKPEPKFFPRKELR